MAGAGPAPGDERVIDAEHPGQESGQRRHRVLREGTVLTIYAVAGALAYGAHSPISATTLPPCACNDLALQVWFLEWPAYAMTHGHDPFFSAWAAYPSGVNLLDNTAAPLLGILLAPLTLLAGPVAALSFAMRAAFAVSGLAMYWALRRWTRWWPAALLGGLLYAFSPFMVGQAQSHVFLTFVPLPPIAMVLLDRLVNGRRPVLTGALLGLVAVAQFLLSPEILAMGVLACALSLCFLALRYRGPVLYGRARTVTVGLASGLATGLVVGAYPAWAYLLGPYHVSGSQHSVAQLSAYHEAVASLVLPTSLLRFGLALSGQGNSLAQGDIVEHASYVGVPLLAFIVVVIIRYRTSARVLLFGLLAGAAWVISLGPVLYIASTAYTWAPMPYRLLERLPLLNAGLDLRYSFLMYLSITVLLALGLDRTAAPGGKTRYMTCLVLGVAVLLPMVPALPYQSTPLGTPAVYTANGSPVKRGDVVLNYPLPVGYIGSNDQALLWQAVAGMRFKVIGFRGALGGLHHQRLVQAAVLLAPAQAEDIMVSALYGQPPMPPEGLATSEAVRQFLIRYRVDDVVIAPWGPGTASVVSYFQAALSHAPVDFQGSYVWHDARSLAATELRR